MAEAAENDEEYEKLVKIQRLKAAVHYTVGRICEECEQDVDAKFSKQFIAALSEATYRYSQTMSRDLELFAKHAKRTTVNADDVLLMARKSSNLSALLHQLAEEQVAAKEEQAAKRKDKKKETVAKTDTEYVDAEDSNL